MSRITSANMSHSTCAKARKICSFVRSACSRRRASSMARSMMRCAVSAILLGDMSRSSTCTYAPPLSYREEQDVGQCCTVAESPQTLQIAVRRFQPQRKRNVLSASAARVTELRPGQREQRLNALFGGRVGAEEGQQPACRKGLDDEHVGGGGVGIE